MWALHKDIVGFTFDGVEKTPKRDALLTILHGWIRATRDKSCGIPFVQFQSVIPKLRHAFISIPAGKGLFLPCNSILRKRTTVHFPPSKSEFADCIKGLPQPSARINHCSNKMHRIDFWLARFCWNQRRIRPWYWRCHFWRKQVLYPDRVSHGMAW